MSTTLPHGLISVGYSDVPTVKKSHYADILFERSQVLHSFWKVHAIRHRVSRDVSDFRCQNLFWRTWGDSRLSKTISTAALTTLWSSCQQAIDLLSLQEEFELEPLSSSRSRSTKTLKSSNTSNSCQDEQESPSVPSLSVSDITSSQQSSVSTRFRNRGTSIDENGSIGDSVDSDRKATRGSRPGLSRAGSGVTKTPFGALSSRTKGRPSMNRRKSSQGASQNKPTKLSKTIMQSPKLIPKEIDKVDVIPSAAITSTFELPPASSWEDEPAATGPRRLSTSPSCSSTPSELVEPNFRNKFAERIASSSNLAGMNRMKKTGSVVRFADEVPQDLRMSKELESESTFENELRPKMSHRESIASVTSVAVIDEDNVLSPGLARTKSQLSLLIDEKRTQQKRDLQEAEASLGQVGISSRRKRDPTDEEKVLAMAHKEGFTRAGGRQIRKGFKFRDESESRYSSPSPPPIF